MKRSAPYLVPVTVITPLVIAADTTPAAIDLVTFDAAQLMLYVGIGGITFDGSNKIEFKLTHSDDDSSYSDIAAKDVVLGSNCDAAVGTGGIVYSLVAAHAAATITTLSYVGGKRYLKVLADFTGTHGTGTMIAAFINKAYAHVQA